MNGRIHQINLSEGGVPKRPVDSAVVNTRGVVGDLQTDTVHHGHPEQALCIWSLEVIEALQAEGHPIAPGYAGENITVAGLDWNRVLPGTTLLFGEAVVAPVTFPATPCSKNAAWFLQRDFRRMSHDRHPGWSRMYASVVTGGTIQVGDSVRLLQ
ncbi:MAG TPA: MOSC domain-containing protein [Acidimicrobiia bacterium]|nr:MOSC domain-containing protein [Acidimicrobiia bacterium]